MNIEELRTYCLSVKGVTESTPFGDDVLVYKVMNKMFAYFPLFPKEGEPFVVLKCDPEKTVELRDQYQGVTKGYYAGNNLLWNSVFLQQDVPNALIKELIDHSVEEVLKKLSKKQQQEYHVSLS